MALFSVDDQMNISIARGYAVDIPVTVRRADNTPYSMVQGKDTLIFTAKTSIDSQTKFIQKESGAPVIPIAASDTTVVPYGSYVYDLVLKHEEELSVTGEIPVFGDIYTETVPVAVQGRINSAVLKMIGGKTVVFNQLVENGDFSDGTTGWLTAPGTNPYQSLSATDGVMTLSATAGSTRSWGIRKNTPTTAGHVYAMFGHIRRDYTGADSDAKSVVVRGIDADSNAETFFTIQTPTAGASYLFDRVFTPTANNIAFTVVTSGSVNTGSARPMYSFWNINLVDMTQLFGAGNELATIEEFRQMFPAEYYQYTTGSLLSMGIDSIVSKDPADNVLQTFLIPAEVKALNGYGFSCPSGNNYIDFEQKKFIQQVGSRAYIPGDESDGTVITDGVMTQYEINPYLETDISAYLPGASLVVKEQGTVTFKNSNGDDYRLPLPVAMGFVWEDVAIDAWVETLLGPCNFIVGSNDDEAMDEYRRLLTSQYKTRQRLTQWLLWLLSEGMTYRFTLTEIINAFDLDTAVGAQLDTIGRIVGVNRLLNFYPIGGESPVMDDDTYRLVIKARIVQNYWKGTLPELYESWGVLFPGITLQLQDQQDMTYNVVIMGAFTSLMRELIVNGYIVPKPEGVRIALMTITDTTGLPLFAYDLDNLNYSGYTAHWATITP